MSSTLAEGTPLTEHAAGTGVQTASYTLPLAGVFVVESVVAEIDASGSGDVTPVLVVADKSGQVIARKRQGEAVTGGTAAGSATWALRLADERAAAAGGGDYVFIAEQTPDLSGQIVFAAIPQAYRHLVLDLSLSRTLAGPATALLKWNNATVYDSGFAFMNDVAGGLKYCTDHGDGDGVYLNYGHVNGAVGFSRAYELPGTGTRLFTSYVVQFPWYSRGDRTHHVMWQGSQTIQYTTGSGDEQLFNPPQPIDTITVGTGIGAFGPDSLATLYGVK